MEKIGIIGLGRLGLCFALNIERIGYEVFAVEKSEEIVRQIQTKTLQTKEPEVEKLLEGAKNIHASTNYELLEGIQNIFCFVATPSNTDGAFDHSQIEDVIKSLKEIKKEAKINLIICCTTMPGFCDSLQEEVINDQIIISYNPEFIAQGNIIQNQIYPDQVLIGSTDKESIDFLKQVYQKLTLSNPTYLVLSPKEAEISKLATNCFLTMKIAFANALGDACSTWNVNPENVLNAIGTDSRIGNKYLKYGFGFGGPCFPRDNAALIHATDKIKVDFDFSKVTIRENQKHYEFQLNELLQKDKEFYSFDSLGYKDNSDIIEESQQLRLALGLINKGKKVIVRKDDLARESVEKLYSELFIFE